MTSAYDAGYRAHRETAGTEDRAVNPHIDNPKRTWLAHEWFKGWEAAAEDREDQYQEGRIQAWRDRDTGDRDIWGPIC